MASVLDFALISISLLLAVWIFYFASILILQFIASILMHGNLSFVRKNYWKAAKASLIGAILNSATISIIALAVLGELFKAGIAIANGSQTITSAPFAIAGFAAYAVSKMIVFASISVTFWLFVSVAICYLLIKRSDGGKEIDQVEKIRRKRRKLLGV